MRSKRATSTGHHAVAPALVCAWLACIAGARAQSIDGGAQADAARAEVAEPPGVLRLAPIQLEPGVALPSGDESVDIALVIDAQGRARLDDVLEPGPLRSAIEHALEQSEFRPASRAGVPVAARVRLSLRVAAPATPPPPIAAPPPTAAVPVAPPKRAQQTARAAEDPDTPSYGASGRVQRPTATGKRLELREMRDLPGAFGDPFRVLDALPGVVPALSGLPYVYVRGAPPAGTVYYYDGIAVPTLFHLALGPAVVHPALVGPIDFYASVAPGRYGRYTGGVLSGGPSARPTPTAASGELELRAVDASGMLEIPLGGGSLIIAGRYGYPGPILSLLSPDASLAYWDYQTRLTLPLSTHDRFELTWFGSFDRAGSKDFRGNGTTLTLEFHRAEARFIRSVDRFEFGSAIQLGYERSQIDEGLQVHSARFGPRVWAQWRGENGLRLRVGADFFGTVGRLHAPLDQDNAVVEIRVPIYADVAGRSVSGAYAELTLPLWSKLRLDIGLRGDAWLTGSRAEAAIDPRLTLTYRSHENIAWHIAAGLGHQPAVFLIPLPGIADVGLEHGLQSAVQSEAGVALDLPAQLRLESQAYLQHLDNMILPDLVLEQSDDCNALPVRVADMTLRCSQGYPRATAWAYGLEVFLRRASTEALSGWLSYTLGWARARNEAGKWFTPSFDVRHVLNLVLQYRIGGGFSAGARLQYRSGKDASATFVRAQPIRYEQRLPGFFRADLQLAYAWATNWGRMRVSLEWFNVTLSREATDIQCKDGVATGIDPLTATPCAVTRAPALFFPNLGVRAEF